MPICDLCERPTGPDARQFSAPQIRIAVRMGLRPGGFVERQVGKGGEQADNFSLNGLFKSFFQSSEPGAVELPRKLPVENVGEWIERVMANTVDWTVCFNCASAIDNCLTEAAAKGRGDVQSAPAVRKPEPAKEQSEVRVRKNSPIPEARGEAASATQSLASRPDPEPAGPLPAMEEGAPQSREFEAPDSVQKHLEELSAPRLPKLVKPEEVNFQDVNMLSEVALDRLPYGLITVDAEGKVLFYNEWQARFAGLPRYLVLGRNFFGEVAPCTRAAVFEGRFRNFVKEHRTTSNSARVEMFDYVFTFVQFEYVRIVFAPGRNPGTFNIMVFKQGYEKFNSPADLYRTLELGALKHMSNEDLDMMSYGVITLDKNEYVTAFNYWEAQLAGISRHRVMHEHWFRAVAPCTRVNEFEGRYQAYRKGEVKPQMFEFIFPFSAGAQFVNCIFTPAKEEQSVNIVVFKRKLII
jgi:photoactive yellow protein